MPVEALAQPATDPPLTDEQRYLSFASRITADGILSDPWVDGRPRFRDRPLVLRAPDHLALTRAAEEVCAAYNEVAKLCAADPELLDRFFGLTPFQRLMWDAAAPSWHGLARADVFVTADGPRVCELNCDTPSGEAEAVLLNAAAHAAAPHLIDPSRTLGDRFCDLIAAVAPRPAPLTVGIIYPTELPEDLSMIRIYQRWLNARGFRVVLGSPFNLRRIGARGCGLFDIRCDVFVRHYKTDWWGERQPVWDDEAPFADAAPLTDQLAILVESALSGECAIVNPFGAVLTQNKRAMAFMWEEISRFPEWAQNAIRRYIPFSIRLEQIDSSQLHNKDEWVLKSDYGCEGAEVVIGADATVEEWSESLRHAIKSRWIAQRFFRALPDEEGATVNHGVYLVAGEAAGYLTRIQKGATDCHAVTVPTLVEES
jgi:glutathionylspermidine synthase